MSAVENAFGYSAPVWERFGSPAHAGAFGPGEPGVVSARAGSASAKSLLSLSLKLEGGVAVASRFKAYGCPNAIAVGEWLAQQLEGKTVEVVKGLKITAPAIRQVLEIAEDRAHCALMGEDLYRALLQQM